MVVLAERRSSRAALWAARLSTFSAVLFVVAGLGHRFGLVETIGFFWVLGLVAALALAALVLAGGRLLPALDPWRPRRHQRGARRHRGAARAVAVPRLGLARLRLPACFPTFRPTSTDPPPLDAAARLRTGEHEPGRRRSRPSSGACRRMPIPTSPAGAIRSRPTASRNSRQHWCSTMAGRSTAPPSPPTDGGDGMIEALARTAILAFPVDVSIRITDEGDTSYVDMRSASRYGRHDLGDNAARIAGFLTALDAAVAGAAGPRPPSRRRRRRRAGADRAAGAVRRAGGLNVLDGRAEAGLSVRRPATSA